MNEEFFKYDEIKSYFIDYVDEQLDCNPDWVNENLEDIHYHCFNTDYYITGRYQAKEWLGDNAFDAIGIIRDYELDMFGEQYTDLSEPEKVVNMYAYIVGEHIVEDWKQLREAV